MSGPLVDAGTLMLAATSPAVSSAGMDILHVLARPEPPQTLDQLAERMPQPASRPWVFYAVAKLEDGGWLEKGRIR